MAATAPGATDNAARQAFGVFFTSHHRELGRLAFLLSGDQDAAEDLTAEAFAEAWRRWGNVTQADSPLAYVRRIVVNLAADRIRGLTRERKGRRLLGATWSERTSGPDVAVVTDVRAALTKLPARKRACVVLRHYYGLSEQETARTLGISVGTVKSQTSRGVAELAEMLGTGSETTARTSATKERRRRGRG
jgi:RNA polymerase sigma-70 factor (sigma-E family)